MSVNIINNYNLNASIFLDNRKSIENLNTLKSVSESGEILYPYGFEVFCMEEGAYFVNVAIQGTPEWEQRMSIEDEMISFTTTYSSQKISELLRSVATISDDIISNETTYSSQKIIEIIRSNMGNGSGGTGIGANINDEQQSATTTYSSQKIESVFSELRQEITRVDDDLLDMDNRVEYLEGEMWKLYGFDGSYDSLTNKPSLEDYATKEYVDISIANAQINGGSGGSVDLSDYATKKYVDDKVKLPTIEQITINTVVDMPFIAYTPSYINSRKELLGCELTFTAMVIDNTETEEYHEETIKVTFTQEIVDGLYSTSEGVGYFLIENFLDAEERKNITGMIAFYPGSFIIELYQGDKIVGGVKDTILTKTVKVYEKDTLIDVSYMEDKLPFYDYEQFIEPSYEDDNKFYFYEDISDPSILKGAKLMFVIGGAMSSSEEDEVIDIVELEFTDEVYNTFLQQGGMYRLDQILTPEENSRNLYGGFAFTEVGGQGLVFSILNTPSEEPDSVYYKVPEASLEIKVKGYANDTLVDKEYVDNTIADIHSVILKVSDEELNFIEQKVSDTLEYDNRLTYITKSDLSSIIDNNVNTVIFEGYERYPYKVVGAYYGFNYNECVILERAFSDSSDDNYAIQRLVFTYSDDMGCCYLKSYCGDLANIASLPEDVVISNSISMGRKEGTTIGERSFAVGHDVEASGSYSHAEGNNTKASGEDSHAEGYYTIASAYDSHAEGCETIASGEGSHAEGKQTTASGYYSHAEGSNTIASGLYSHAEGYTTTAGDEGSHAEGYLTIASSEFQHVQGKCNIEDTTSTYAHIVGNGTADNARSNAHTLDWDGNAWYAGQVIGTNLPWSNLEIGELIIEQTVLFEAQSDGTGVGYTNDIPLTFAEGEKICFTFDDKQYICETRRIDNYNIYIGNGTLSDYDEIHNNEPFGVNFNKYGDIYIVRIYTIEKYVGLEVPVKIEKATGELHKLDEKYLPDIVYDKFATKEYVDGVIDTDNLVVINSISMGRMEGTTIGEKSVALGMDTEATSKCSYAEGLGTTASGICSHAEGYYTTASDTGSHAEGDGTTASGGCSHAEGYYTTASNSCSHAEGFATTASGLYSHAEGSNTIASSENQHVQGKYNIEDSANTYAHIVGNGELVEGTQVVRSNAHTLDWNGNAWFAGDVKVGADNKELATKEYVDDAVGNISAGSDIDTNDLVITNSISMGRKAGTTIGTKSVALGSNVEASGSSSHAEGSGSTAKGTTSHAEGVTTNANGYASHAEGSNTNANGDYTHTEGYYVTANGNKSHAEGSNTRANGEVSHAEGYQTIASSEYQHVQGKFNIEDSANTYAHIVGNGTSSSARSNAHTLDWDGNAWFAGNVTVDGTPTADNDLVTKKYVDDVTGNLPIFNIPQDESSHELTLCELLMPYSRINANGVLKTYISYTFSGGQGVYITTDRYIKVMTNDDESVRSDYRQLLYIGELQWLSGESDNYYPFVQYIDILNGIGEIGNKRFVFTGAVDNNWNIVELSYVIKDRSIATKEYVDEAVANLSELKMNIVNGLTFANAYINYNNGDYVSGGSAYACQEYIPVISGATYEVSGVSNIVRIAYYDSSKAYINQYVDNTPTFNFTPPSNASYIRVHVDSNSNAWQNLSIKSEIENYIRAYINSATSGGSGNVDLSLYALKTDLHSHSNKSVIDTITSDMFNKWNQAIPFNDTYASDCNAWLTNGYIKTGAGQTSNLPSACTGSDRWGILFFIAENVEQGTGTQMYFPIDGTYKGRIFTRSLTNMKASGSNVGEWNLISVSNVSASSLANESTMPTISDVSASTNEGYLNGLLSKMETLEEKIKVLEERIRTLEEGE